MATTKGKPVPKRKPAPVDGSEAVESYIASFSGEARTRLEEMRAIVRSAAKGAEERISYGMPACFLGGPVVYYAAFKSHIGLYPTPSGIEAFEADLASYRRSKGAVRFPMDAKLPVALIKRIVKHRIAALAEKGQPRGLASGPALSENRSWRNT